MPGDQQIFMVELGAEQCRIIRIDDDIQSRVHHAVNRVIGRSQIAKLRGEGGRRRADGEENPVLPACRNQRRIVNHMIAVIDTIATEQLQRIPNMG